MQGKVPTIGDLSFNDPIFAVIIFKGGKGVTANVNKERNIFLILKRSVIDIYNHLGYSLLVSFIWFLVFIPIAAILFNMLMVNLEQQDNPLILLFLLLIFGVPYCAFIFGPVQTALFYQMDQVIDNEAEFKGLWTGLRKHYWLSVRVYGLYGGMLIFCLVDLLICLLAVDHFGLKILGIFLFYLFCFLLLIALYLPGFLVLQENTVKKIFKKALILTLDNVLITIGVFLLLGLIGVGFTLITPLLIFFYGGLIQVVMIYLFRGVMAKYPDPVDRIHDE